MAKFYPVFEFKDDDIVVVCKMPMEVESKLVYKTLSSLFKSRMELVPTAGEKPLEKIHFGEKYRGKF